MTREQPLPHVALSRHAHNRLGLQRTEAAWLEARMDEPSTRVLVVAGNPLDDLYKLEDVRLVLQGGETRVHRPA